MSQTLYYDLILYHDAADDDNGVDEEDVCLVIRWWKEHRQASKL